jgi:creatinine amidohydrolase
MRNFVLALTLACVPLASAAAQRPPDTVFLEELTWTELRDLIKAGKTSVIVATAGTEQKGPHMAIGEHKYTLEYTTDKIARQLGNAIVAPIITYVPEGSWENPGGHMRMPGTITLPNDRFMTLLEHTVKSLVKSGFTDIILIGDSGGNQDGMRDVALKVNGEWAGNGNRVHWIGDYYAKAMAEQRKLLVDSLKLTDAEVGSHAGVLDSSELMYVDATLIRPNKLAPNGGMQGSGVTGDPTKATKEIGKRILDIKIANAVAQIKASLAAPKEDNR